MAEDIYYETPRLPMFIFMEETNLVRVRVLRYKNGKLDAVLADWDADNAQYEFYSNEHWNTENEEPFYCMYKNRNGELLFGLLEFECFLDEEAGYWKDYYTKEELRAKIMYDIERVNCPIFDNIEEARDYVFGRK